MRTRVGYVLIGGVIGLALALVLVLVQQVEATRPPAMDHNNMPGMEGR